MEKETKKQIDFEKYKIFEIPFSRVKFENDKSLFIDINNREGIFINKNSCYKPKKYEFKQAFLLKIFEEFEYEIRDIHEWEDVECKVIGKKLFDKLEDLDEEY